MLVWPSATFMRSPSTIPYIHCTIGLVPRQRPPIWPMDHIVIFSFLSLFSFTWRVLSWPGRSQVNCTVRSGPYHTFHCTQTLCSFYLLFVFKTFVSTPKNKEVFPQNSDLSLFRLIICLTPSCTFVLLRTSNILHTIALSWTLILHHFALLDTMSGDHFTALELHPLELHRIHT